MTDSTPTQPPPPEMKGRVFNIQRFSLHDGPGVRTTVFLKGCPLSCLWCHNPEGISALPEVIYRENRCVQCEECVLACPTGAITSASGLKTVEDALCDRCGRCEEACATGALEIAGKTMTVEQVMAEIERDTVFYDQSGGGVTFSGGEPLLQAAFLRELLGACRGHEIHTTLDTTGFAPLEVVRSVAPRVSLFLFDLKAADPERHRAMTGVENGPILRSLKELARIGSSVVLRIPIVPEVNDDEANLLALGDIARSMGDGQRVDLLPYHSIASDKYRRLRRSYRLSNTQLPTSERMSELAALLGRLGLDVRIGG